MTFDRERCLSCNEWVEVHGWCHRRHRHTCWSSPCPPEHTECEKPL